MAAPKKKLAISCGDSDCSNGLHCFRVTAKKISEYAAGTCQACGAEPVDFGRIQKRSLDDVEHTMAALDHELIRNFFLKLPLGQKAKNYALRKGKKLLCETVAKRLTSSIGSAQPFHDGWQTPMEENGANPIWNAQHATATCCRRCVEYWHGIPRGQELQPSEIDYLSGLVITFLDEKLPDLPEQPTKVPRTPRK
jgi:hypothetical protein